jgi:spermidine synthase
MMPEKKQSIKEENYEEIYDCIVTDQVPPDKIAEYLADEKFYKYYIKRRARAV